MATQRVMGRLANFDRLTDSTFLGDLWAQVTEDAFVLREPERGTPEAAARSERRQRLLRDSAIPWVLSDLTGLLSFYDDIQDIFAFSRWNRQLFSPSRIRRCVQQCLAQSRRSPRDCLLRCVCGLQRRDKRAVARSFQGFSLMGLALGTWMLRLFPGTAPFMWLLLAGQVSYSLFGVGLRLGAIVGAGVELHFRGLEAFGLPFGPEHNKYHQLKRARVLQRGEAGWNAARLLGNAEWLRATKGIHEAWRDLGAAPETVIAMRDYPDIKGPLRGVMTIIGRGDVLDPGSWAGVFQDTFETGKNLFDLAMSLPGNAVAYLHNDILRDLHGLPPLSGAQPGEVPDDDYTPEQLGVLKWVHAEKCPGGVCPGVADLGIDLMEWAEGIRDVQKSRRRMMETLPELMGPGFLVAPPAVL